MRLPAPAFVRPNPGPPMAPPTVRLPVVTVTVGLRARVTGPVPRFRSFGPLKPKLAFQICALMAARVIGPPLALPSSPRR